MQPATDTAKNLHHHYQQRAQRTCGLPTSPQRRIIATCGCTATRWDALPDCCKHEFRLLAHRIRTAQTVHPGAERTQARMLCAAYGLLPSRRNVSFFVRRIHEAHINP